MSAIKFSKQYVSPNPDEIDYWIDLSANQYGGKWKYFNGISWIDLINPDGTSIDANDYYTKLQINQMLSNKASVESVESKVDDSEIAEVIKNIEFKDRGTDGIEMVVFKFNGTNVGITLPVASNATSGILTKETFKKLVNTTQLQELYTEMYDKLSKVYSGYQKKLKAGDNIVITDNNVIHAASKIGIDWNSITGKPDLYDKGQVDTMMSGVYKIKGSRTFEELPTEGNNIGDTYNITNSFTLNGEEYELGTNVVWTEEGWDALAGIFDTSELEEDIQEVKDNYLPLSGGTITGYGSLNIKRENEGGSYIKYSNADETLGHLGVSPDKEPVFIKNEIGYKIYHDGNFNPNDYLPLSGGTITGLLQINRNPSAIQFKVDDMSLGYLGVSGNDPVFWNAAGNTNYKIFHEGNDGHDSGLDADTLDGYHAKDFLTSNNVDTFDITDISYKPGIYSFLKPAESDIFKNDFNYGKALVVKTPDSDTFFALLSGYSHDKLLYRRGNNNNIGSTLWKQIAFTDSDITGNAATATKLKTPVKLWGNDFDGSGDISEKIVISTINDSALQIFNSKSTTIGHSFGNATGEYLIAYLKFKSVKANVASPLNRITFDIHGHDDLFNILGNGNVGIGVNNPLYKLDVNGNVAATLFYAARTISSDVPMFYCSATNDPDVTILRIDQSPGNTTYKSNYGYSLKYIGSGNGKDNLLNLYADNLLATTQVLAISVNNQGNVGIGTTNPQYMLDVSDTFGCKSMYTRGIKIMHSDGDQKMFIGNQYSIDSSKQGTAILTYDANPLRFYNNGNVSMTITGSNNVGIGIDDPTSKLHVRGSIIADSVDSYSKVSTENKNGKVSLHVHSSRGIWDDTDEKWMVHKIPNSKTLVLNNGSVFVNEYGNVTIGEYDKATTNYKLYVDGNTSIKKLKVDEEFHIIGNANFRILNDSNQTYIQSGYGETLKGFINITGYNNTQLTQCTIKASNTLATGNIITQQSLEVHNQITSGDLVDWYGVSWSEDSSDPTCTRIGNMALHRSLPILSAMKGYYISNSQSLYNEYEIPLKDDWSALCYNITDNTQIAMTSFVSGNIMVKIPEFWYIDDYEPSTKTHNLKISQTAKAGWRHHKEAYVGAYEGRAYDTHYKSVKGVIPTVSVTRETIRTKARANGFEGEYKWNIYTYEEHRAICHLFLVEYATRNSQAPVNTELTADGFKQGGLGSGCTTGTMDGAYTFIPTGTTDSLGNGSGQVAYTASNGITYYANRYRGIENPFGHIWKHVDDVVNIYNAESGTKTVYKCEKPEHFATNKNAKYKPLCSFPGGLKMQGWSKEIKATINCDFFKYSVGDSESTYWCDYNYDNDDTSEHCLLIGGSSGYGGWAGLFFFNLNGGVSSSNVGIGSRLTYLPWAE